MKITVVGTGYVGLVTGTCFAEGGNDVVCVDTNEEKVKKLLAGEIPIYEPGLEKLFLRNLKEERLYFTTSLAEGVKNAELIFLALPTPPGEDGHTELKYVMEVAEELGKLIDHYVIVVDKSTVPVGTADKIRAAIAKNAKADFDVVSNPEFLQEGVAVVNFMKPGRVVIGTQSEKAKQVLSDLYTPFVRQGNPIIFMDERSAELTKYAANAFLATKITFMNEIAQLCERFGANVDMVRRGIGSDDRIGKRFLFSGIGYGGSCFPKDVRSLAKSATEVEYDFKILNAVMAVNNKQKMHLIPQIKAYFNEPLKGKRLAIWGLSFKPGTDDVREAPALDIIDLLLKEGASVCAFDPEAMNNVKILLGDKISYAETQYEALQDADALIITTEWSVFRTPDFDKMEKKLKNKAIFDGRNLFDVTHMEKLGFHYISIGRKKIMFK